MRYKIEIKSIWEVGQRVDSEGNPHQEDSIFPAFNEQKDTDRFFVLCDGMGGHEAGEVASSTVCNAMSKSVFGSTSDPEGDFDNNMMQKAIADAFDALDSLDVSDADTEKKMGTTMTCLKLHNKGCTIAHMGDSRVYHIRPGKDKNDTGILFHTTDHSLINDLIKIGELTEEEAKESKQKNIITRAMQPKMERRPKASIYSTTDIKAGDYFFMCSDGMLEQMEDENVRFIFSDETGNCEDKTEMLTKATSQNRDNHSAIIVHILDVIDPLPVEQKVQATSKINAPAPFMAEIDEDSDTECCDTEPDNADKAIDTVKQKLNQSAKGSRKKKKIIKYVLMFFLTVVIVAGIYFITSAISQKENTNEKEQELTERDSTHHRKPRARKIIKPSQNETTIPDKQNENNHIETPQHENTNVNGHANESATDNTAQQGAIQQLPHKRKTSIKMPTKNNTGGEKPVSSDEQQTLDAINNVSK